MNEFWKGLQQGVAVIVTIIIAIILGWLLFMFKQKNPIEAIGRAYGEITNPAKKTDRSRAAAIRDALVAVWQ